MLKFKLYLFDVYVLFFNILRELFVYSFFRISISVIVIGGRSTFLFANICEERVSNFI
jgi:hypothetical protein